MLSVVWLASFSAGAQTTGENLAKYEALRTRLKDEFVRIGDAPGKGQPAEERNDQQGFIRWADSTIRLGWYMGVLATEYELYTHTDLYPGAGVGKSPIDTLDELFYALRALERLDEVADASFPPPCTQTPALNGFFLRDDTPADFFNEFPPLTYIRSDFVDPELTNKEMSQDQVYHLLIGLALVKRFIPASAQANGKALRSWAVEQAERIIQHVSKDAWVIMNPACDREVNRGPLALGFSGGTRLAIGFITDGAFVPDTTDIQLEIWAAAADQYYAPYIDIDNLHMGLAIAAVGNGWGDATAENVATLAEKPDWPAYPLLHRALHGDDAGGWCNTGTAVNARAKKQLDELPAGADVASPQPGGPASHGWTQPHRYLRGTDKAYSGEDGSEGLRYPALDYMLLHNLYAIATPATWNGSSGPGIPECKITTTPEGGTGASASEDEGGCGCRVPAGSPTASAWWLAALALLFRSKRRR
jgi:MYXO-CTERM domain-containing protein